MFLSKRSVFLPSPFHPVHKDGELGFAGDAGVVDVPLPIDKLAAHSNPLDAGNQYALFICILLLFLNHFVSLESYSTMLGRAM